MEAKVLIVLNCSLAPAPGAIVTYAMAQAHAEKNSIQTGLSISQQTVNGFLIGNSATNNILMDKSFTHLMLASDDTAIPEDAITRLVQDDKDIVSGVYRMRDPVKNALAIYGEPGESFDEWLKEGTLVQRPFSSAHSMTIKREVLEAVVEKSPEMSYYVGDSLVPGIWIPYVKNNKLYCDDWAFCQRAKDAGFTCWIDFGVKLKHRSCDVWLEV